MDQSERIRHLQEQSKRFVSRNKCMDSYARTMLVVQPKASGTGAPKTVALSCGVPAASYAAVVPVAIPTGPTVPQGCGGVAKGKGTNGEYIGLLQAKQACALNNEVQGGVIALPVPCIDQNAPPFTQSDMTKPDTWTKVPCVYNETYFPPKIYDGANCDYTRITTPSG